MALLPLACEPLEYLRGRFTSEEKQQDRVRRNVLYLFLVFLFFFLLLLLFIIMITTCSVARNKRITVLSDV